MTTGFFVVALLLWAGPDAGTAATPDREGLRARLAALASTTRTGRWVQESWARKGEKRAWSKARCLWAAPGRVRLEMLAGQGEGTLVFLRAGRVIIRPPGVLGVMKLTWPVEDEAVKSLRGTSLASAGFVDDLEHLLASWDRVALAEGPDGTALSWVGANGLPTRMVLARDSGVPFSIEASEGGQVVERTVYREVELNPPLAAGSLEP